VFRLRTVRLKLLSLVGLSIAVALVMLPLLSWLLHEQLREEIEHGLVNAEQAYQAELDDDVTDSELASTVLAADASVHRAMRDRDVAALQAIADTFARLYPDMDIAFVDRKGDRLARVGCDEDGPPLADTALFEKALAGHVVVELSPRGCDRTPMPTYLIARPASDLGVVVVGLDFSQASLAHAATKLNLELALVDPDGALLNHTAKFPANMGSPSFALKPFSPKQLNASHGKFSLLAALDITQMRSAIRRDLFVAMFVVAVVALGSLTYGLRLANAMSGALKRLSDAVGRLARDDYVKLEPVESGDEFETLAKAFNTMVEGLHERDKLRTTFGKYMTASVMDHLLAGAVQLGGEAITATILFADIRGFTAISEHMDARALVSLLNEYFTDMVDVVIQEDGVVDKYIGDAIMVVFGPPVTKPNDALRAVRAAVGMGRALARLNERLAKRGMKPIATGIGVHTGEVVAGNIGSERRMEYTVIGDAVNVASRLETATKELAVPILVSSDTYELVKDAVDARPVGKVAAKGRESVLAYALLGLK
jgi:adenylate cyclase